MPNQETSGGREPHRYRAHKKYPFCRVCGYARSEWLMHPPSSNPAAVLREPGKEDEMARQRAEADRDFDEDLMPGGFN